MFFVDFDQERGLAVVGLAPPGTDADWIAYADAIDEMNRTIPPGVRPVLLQLIRSGMPMPSALVRRRLADLRATIRRDAINVVVSDSATLRAAQTALDWVRKPHYDSSTHAAVESAIAHVERALGSPAPGLGRLAARAELAMRR
ncbi:hypothetical protein [Sandaracinus amylolyticus]|nr:hypothetical protein [Sandaracinus amylolyticus]